MSQTAVTQSTETATTPKSFKAKAVKIILILLGAVLVIAIGWKLAFPSTKAVAETEYKSTKDVPAKATKIITFNGCNDSVVFTMKDGEVYKIKFPKPTSDCSYTFAWTTTEGASPQLISEQGNTFTTYDKKFDECLLWKAVNNTGEETKQKITLTKN